MELAHYEALLIQKHQADVGVDFVPQLSHTGSILYEATTRLITILDYFSQKGNFEDMPLTMYALQDTSSHKTLNTIYSRVTF